LDADVNTVHGEDYRGSWPPWAPSSPSRNPSGEYRVIHDLNKKPATGEVEDISKINRIFWVDDKPNRSGRCERARLRPIPQQIVAFFPVELEREMLRMELDYRHRREDQIRETRFHVENKRGRYAPVIV